MPNVEVASPLKPSVECGLGLPSPEEACVSARNLINYITSLNGIEENYSHPPLVHPSLAAKEASIKLSYIEKSIRDGEINSPGELVKLVHSIHPDVYKKLAEGLICSGATTAAHRLWVTINKEWLNFPEKQESSQENILNENTAKLAA